MIELDLLFDRPPLGPAPLCLILRSDPDDDPTLLFDYADHLLAPRALPDQIVVITDRWPATPLPARRGNRRWQLLVVDQPTAGAALEQAISRCRCRAIVLTDSSTLLTHAALNDLLEGLEHCDLVMGRRHSHSGLLHRGIGAVLGGIVGTLVGWWVKWNPAGLLVGMTLGGFLGSPSWLLRQLLGVPFTDPLCPVLAVRSNIITGVPLERQAPIDVLELVSKLTYLGCLIDEQEVEVESMPPAAAFWQTVKTHWTEIGRLFASPRFWRYQPAQDNGRPTLEELAQVKAPAPPIAPTPSAWRKPMASHPLRPPVSLAR